jgi:aldehyde:ferredoxin oxidoreductase
MKKVIGKVRLCPNTPAWSNVENNIFLSKARRKESDVYEGCDMEMIMKAVEAGLIEFKEIKQEVKQVKQPAAKQAKNKKVNDIVQEAKKKAAAKAKKEEVHVDVNVVNKEDKPVEPENKPE